MTKFNHTCEVCEKEELLTPEESFNAGWDYPPNMGAWTIISPRTCGNCLIDQTLWWALVVDKTPAEDLPPKHQATLKRILAEVPQ